MPRKRNLEPTPSKPTKRPQVKEPVVEREPWTPWGKWLKRRRERIEQRRIEREERRRQKLRARQIRRIRRRVITTRGTVFIGLMALACGIGMLVLILLGRPYPWEALSDVTTVMRIEKQMEVRQMRWEELAIHDYTVEVSYRSRTAQCGPYIMEVRSDEIAGSPRRDPERWFPAEACNSLQLRFMIDHAYSWLREELGNFRPGDTYLNVNFDPVLGYPIYAEAATYDLTGAPPDCCWQITWSNLQPIEP